jgi:feruloyl esterase
MIRSIELAFATAWIAFGQIPCEQLKSLSVSNTTITVAESVPAGPFQAPGSPTPSTNLLPAHCRVAAVLAPSSDSHIEMEVWLPMVESWNGKFQAVGNGGWAGNITFGTGAPQPVNRTMASALKEGYATASNDTGHHGTGADASFADGHPEKLRDFADRAVHEMAVRSKAIIGAFYGREPTLSYWNGCSTGGRPGLMEAQRHPEDFDGIVAGAPANYWTHLMAGIVWAAQATHKGQPGNMTLEKLSLLHGAVLRACDALDGVKDGVLEDPTRCKFDPEALECKGAEGPACLTRAQVEGRAECTAAPSIPAQSSRSIRACRREASLDGIPSTACSLLPSPKATFATSSSKIGIGITGNWISTAVSPWLTRPIMA